MIGPFAVGAGEIVLGLELSGALQVGEQPAETVDTRVAQVVSDAIVAQVDRAHPAIARAVDADPVSVGD